MSEERSLAEVVRALSHADDALVRYRREAPCRRQLPSRAVLVEVLELLRSVLFPGYYGDPDLDEETLPYRLGATLDRVRRLLLPQVQRGLAFACEEREACPRCEARAPGIVSAFLALLPTVRALLLTDVQAAYERDPAATSPDEAIFCYPGIQAITVYRLSHELHRLGVPLIPRILTEHAHGTTGIDIHPGATIGSHFFIGHGTGVVVGETCIIGDRVSLYQGVTLGARSFPLDERGRPIKGIPRHPIVEDDVVIYSGATILGRVRIGRGSTIGGNVWLTRDVPPHSRVTQAALHEERFQGGSGI